MVRHLPLLLALVASAASAQSTNERPTSEGPANEGPGPEVIAVAPDAATRMTVPVQIGANGPYRFLLDTGAQNTVISGDLAQRLALPPDRPAKLVGVAGVLPVQTVLIDELRLGRRTYYTLTAPVLESRHIGADGIIGIDTLQDQRVLIDFRRGQITVDDARGGASPSDYEIVVRARSRSGQLIMTDAVIDGVRTAVVIDTGAETTIGNLALLDALNRRHSRLDQTQLYSVTGQVLSADVALVRRFDLHGLQMSNVLVAFAAAPPFAHLGLDTRPAILLGMRELRAFPRVAIDFRGRRVMFDLPDGPPLRPLW